MVGLAIHYVSRAIERWEPRIKVLPLDAKPNPDDPTKLDLLVEYRVHATGQDWQQVSTTCPAWPGRAESDPGTVLGELFAYLTEALIYRLNRLPDKAFVEFLRLIGVTVHPPAAAR